MASSRWKRFAFFDRHTLNLPSQVLEDLLPESDAGRSTSNNNISMVLNTAALPKEYQINASNNNNNEDGNPSQQEQQQALSQMWSSLTACSEPPLDQEQSSRNIHLPSQQQQQQQSHTTVISSGTAMDGLVLLWVASPKTNFVHCLDLTVRCSGSSTDGAEAEMDGWRGYFMASPTESGIVDVVACRMPVDNGHSPLYVACLTECSVEIYVDPHLHLSCRLPVTTPSSESFSNVIKLATPWNETQHGRASTLDLVKDGLLAIGTDSSHVLLYNVSPTAISLQQTIPPPPQGGVVTCVKLNGNSIFCTYQKGISCFEFSIETANISARHDLDTRPVLSKASVDFENHQLIVARPDGLYTFSTQKKVGVAAIDGMKNCICVVPPPAIRRKQEAKSCSYALVASTDTKSGRYVNVVCAM